MEYPKAPPIAIFRERQARSFDYTLLFPGDPGYDVMLSLSEELPRVGRGHHRVITDLATVADRWPTCPLLGV